MLQELTTATAAQAWAIGSMLLFMAVFALVLVAAAGGRRAELERRARLPLDDDPPAPRGSAGPSALPGAQGR